MIPVFDLVLGSPVSLIAALTSLGLIPVIIRSVLRVLAVLAERREERMSIGALLVKRDDWLASRPEGEANASHVRDLDRDRGSTVHIVTLEEKRGSGVTIMVALTSRHGRTRHVES